MGLRCAHSIVCVVGLDDKTGTGETYLVHLKKRARETSIPDTPPKEPPFPLMCAGELTVCDFTLWMFSNSKVGISC